MYAAKNAFLFLRTSDIRVWKSFSRSKLWYPVPKKRAKDRPTELIYNNYIALKVIKKEKRGKDAKEPKKVFPWDNIKKLTR